MPVRSKAFPRGLHVMVEKPEEVSAQQARQMNGAAKKSRLVFGIMFNK
jgi:predicted dehydrogenase